MLKVPRKFFFLFSASYIYCARGPLDIENKPMRVAIYTRNSNGVYVYIRTKRVIIGKVYTLWLGSATLFSAVCEKEHGAHRMRALAGSPFSRRAC